jgi:subtilisin-like proprotein convertase family protein
MCATLVRRSCSRTRPLAGASSSRLRRALALASALLLALLLAAACGATDDGGPEDAGGPRDVSFDAPALPDGGGGVDVARDGKQPPPDTLRPDGGGQGPFEPCGRNEHCTSGWCVGWDEGYTCTTTCLTSESCPEGWECRGIFGTAPDVVFVCYPAESHLCLPCASDFECGTGFCLEVGAEQRCTRSCDVLRPCPAGYDCRSVTSAESGVTTQQCVPTSGRCDCGPVNAGATRSCQRVSEFGVCYGAETCDEARGWIGCSAAIPTAEDCNGLDDDCDGVADEELTPPDEACQISTPGVTGTCHGVWVCRGSEGWTCTARTPAAESCNYQDDDCDGEIDEDFVDGQGRYVHPNHCGVCGRSCEGTLPHASERCDVSTGEPRCVVAECDPGYVRINDFACVLPTGGPCVPCEVDDHCLPTGGRCVEMTDGLHCARVCTPGDEVGEDCGEGYTCTETEHGDETVNLCLPDSGTCTCTPQNHGRERSCLVENADGRCFGVETCDGAVGWGACDAATPAPEVCNGVDDDCDGFADEGVPPPAEPCRTTWQDPASGELAVCTGDWVCGAEGGVTRWRCFARQAGPEQCNYQDDDCDDVIDEDFKTDGRYASYEHCGACGLTCEGAIPNATTRCDGARPNPICVVERCAPGYYRVSETSCAPVVDSTCTPCANDAGCPVPGDRCLTLDGARYCARDCGPDNAFGTPAGECGPGLACVADADAPTRRHCRPVTGSCTCRDADDAALTRSCIRTNDKGTCAGLQACDPATGWTDCSAPEPAEETCNGNDDDCDGTFDEDVTPPAAPCQQTNAFGTCRGTWHCAERPDGTIGWLCDARAPQAERCDYADNDCDGATDEDFRDATTGIYDGYDNCGLCGYSCQGAVLYAAETACEKGPASARCVVVSCADGYFRPEGLSTVCVPVGGVTDCSPCGEDAHCAGLPGACLPLDGGLFCGRNCPTGTECVEGFSCVAGHCVPESRSCTCLAGDDGASRICFRANTFGTCSGTQACDAGEGWSSCSARVPAGESCNGQDDDCNGLADEGLTPPAPTCQRTNAFGTCSGPWVCALEGGTTDWRCRAAEPAAETCNYRDDDCDGRTDEDFRDALTGRYADAQNCGVCGYSCEGLIPHAMMECDATRPTPACVVAGCDPGYYQQGDYACLPVTNNLCQGCETDTDCPVPGDRCLSLDGARVCGYDCTAGNLHGTPAGTCPANFECVMGQCWPTTGSCSCNEAAEHGATRLCAVSNASGTCFGQETCVATEGWSACDARVPAPETCNGQDDDCDTLVDEGVTPPPTPCEQVNAFGRCTGAWACRAAQGWQCTAQTPAADTCDYVDNDCDGQVDEDFRDATSGAYVADDHCGACGVSCDERIPNATATCRLAGGVPRCEVASCDPGYYQAGALTCLPVVDSSCTPCASDANCPVPGDRCLDLDGAKYCGRDCAAGNLHGTPAGTCPAGYQCRDIAGAPGVRQCVPTSSSCTCLAQHSGATRTCVRANAVGTCYGSETCNPATGWSGCSARVPATEVCNGIDDECNGQADDVAGLGGACQVTATLPNGPHACAGLLVCRPGSTTLQCNAPTPVVERCNYLDDDCDGMTDETYTDLYQSCSAGVGACQRFGFRDCRPDGSGTQCNAVAGAPGVEVCNGIDDNCIDGVDEHWPLKNTACTVGQGTCTRNGVYICNSANPAGAVVCNATPGPEGTEVCDLLDNDCDGVTDEGWLNAGKYDQATACGNCFTDCTTIYAKANAYGVCNAVPATPTCVLTCCRTSSTNARCDRLYDYYNFNAVPDDGCEFRLDPTAIYVSANDPTANDLVGCGRGPSGTGGTNRPCRTIGVGLAEAFAAGRTKVNVADGLYEETVTLRNGISLLGGFRADTWERHVESTLTVVRGTETVTHKSTIIASGISSATTLEGFVIYGPVNATAGGNSYGVYVATGSANLRIVNNTIYGGSAGPGTPRTAAGAGAAGGSGAGRSPCTVSGTRSPNVAIPDNNTTGVSDTLTLSGTCNFGHVVVGVNITHTYIGDLYITVRNPAGTTIVIWNRAGGGTDNLVQSFNVPELVGGAAAGAWVINVSDRGSGDTGRLVSWSVELSGDRAYDAILTASHVCTESRSYANGGAGTCGGVSAAGGAGGGTFCPPVGGTESSARDGATGATISGNGAGGAGGDGGDDGYVAAADPYSCVLPANPMSGADGANGAAGTHGALGTGCSAAQGSVSAGHWLGGAGGNGAVGKHGGGGGGGGSGGGGECRGGYCNGRDRLGGHGGGGGAGGCGGGGGSGGAAGGGSFAIFVVGGAPPTITGNTIFQGFGGEGGAGGNGGTGGAGGNGGTGGRCNGDCWCFASAGKGGEGGAGGHGGGGGGGCGGGSFGIYTSGLSATPTYCNAAAGNTIGGGAAGAGGAGGLSLGNSGTAGTVGRLLGCSFN